MRHRFATAALAIAALAVAPPATAATTYTSDPAHSQVGFEVRHFLTGVPGRFADFTFTIVKDDANPANSSVELVIQAASIDTGIEKRDNHLRSDDFLAVEKHPQITFKSTAVEKVSDSEYKVTGPLTIRGVSKVITVPVSFAGELKDPWGSTRAGFAAETKVDRREFGVTWNKALDGGGFMLGDEVEIEIAVEAVAK
jgi:polyisoprenoid-binding protein YceI